MKNVNPIPVLHAVRALLPREPIGLAELHELLPRLAHAFRLDTDTADVDQLPTDALLSLPSVRVETDPRPYASMTYWNPKDHQWVICLDSGETDAEQRFSLAHELGHIIWHGSQHLLFPDLTPQRRHEIEGYAADLFAGQLLLPYSELSRAYEEGVQEPAALAMHFGVTEQVVIWRLAQTDLPLRSSDDIDADVHPTDRERIRPLVDDAS